MEMLFNGIFDTTAVQTIEIGDFLLCITVSLILGLIIAACCILKSAHTKSFLVTLALLPAIVCVVIMMVNGNIGAGVAVAGAFSLVRFRSAPGSAKEIVSIFLAMAVGLITGMGYLGYAALFTVIMCVVLIAYNIISSEKSEAVNKTIKITIPEDLDYTEVFDDIFALYTRRHELVKIKSTNMGSMFRLTYDITLRDPKAEKQMLDQIRERNGNLEIMLSRQENRSAEL